nr:unnamed protein product [Callosobruchus analis]
MQFKNLKFIKLRLNKESYNDKAFSNEIKVAAEYQLVFTDASVEPNSHACETGIYSEDQDTIQPYVRQRHWQLKKQPKSWEKEQTNWHALPAIIKQRIDKDQDYITLSTREEIARNITRLRHQTHLSFEPHRYSRKRANGPHYVAIQPYPPKTPWFYSTRYKGRALITRVIRMRTNHCSYPAHLYKIGSKDNPNKKYGSLDHIVFKCNARPQQEEKCYRRAAEEEKGPANIKTCRNSKASKALAYIVQEIIRVKKKNRDVYKQTYI